jgi:hypothetical protein
VHNNTSALAFGGLTNPPVIQKAETESWNGTSWTEVNNLNTARATLAGTGTQTAALAFGGEVSPNQQTESWNGTSWTEVNDLNLGRSNLGGAGTQTLALAFGGSPITAATESWNGTNWTNENNLNATRRQHTGTGLQTLALAFGGENPTAATLNTTEEWNGTGSLTRTITSTTE